MVNRVWFIVYYLINVVWAVVVAGVTVAAQFSSVVAHVPAASGLSKFLLQRSLFLSTLNGN